MTGEEWLRRVLDPWLENPQPPSRWGEIMFAIASLEECGVLSEDQARQARRRINERFPALHPPGSHPRADDERVQAVLGPAAPLAEVDGVNLLLVAVELWTSTIVLHLVVPELPQPESPPTWPGIGISAPYADAHRRIGGLPLSLSDDSGTSYRSFMRGGGGGVSSWRGNWHFSPGAPSSATRLTVTVGREDRSASLDLELPAR